MRKPVESYLDPQLVEKARAEFPIARLNKELIPRKDGRPAKLLANVIAAFRMHPHWAGAIAYDAFAERVVKIKPERAPWSDTDSARTAVWFAKTIGFEPSVSLVDTAVAVVAESNVVHPVRDWLTGLEWDGVKRCERLFTDYFGAPDTPYARAIGVRFLISAVARVMRPGCQVDCMPVLEGKQGIRKSTGLEALFGQEWFSDSVIDVGSKDSYQSLRNKWALEFGELDSLKSREITRVKAFLSARVDSYRPSYGRSVKDFKRQLVFVGSTNEDEYLVDRTGNRRFWPVACTRVDVERIHTDRHWLWAEAYTRFQDGEPWHLDSEELTDWATEEQAERVASDAWEEIGRRWLLDPTVPCEDGTRARLLPSSGITVSEFLRGAIDCAPYQISRAYETRGGQVLRKLGFMTRGDKRPRRYYK